MSLAQALAYFSREALLSLVRSWKVSLLALLTITVSIFLAGVFLLVSTNLQRLIDRWQGESRIVVYLQPETRLTDFDRVRSLVADQPWVEQLDAVSAEDARERFRETFPSMADLLEGWTEEPLPPSFEATLDWQELDAASLDGWIAGLREDSAVSMVDDDRDWLAQLQTVIVVLRGLGLLLGGILLATAVFTIASVIRLTAYLYREEIAVMRLVGATEFFIRGPFYVEGLIQGLAGALLALFALWLSHLALLGQTGGRMMTSAMATEFLSTWQSLALIGLGGLAGLVGAVTSLHREDLGAVDADASDD